MAEPAREQLLRGLTALSPFVPAYNLPLNPEDMEEIVYAVLKHAAEAGPLERIIEAVEEQIAAAVHAAMLEAGRQSIVKDTEA